MWQAACCVVRPETSQEGRHGVAVVAGGMGWASDRPNKQTRGLTLSDNT